MSACALLVGTLLMASCEKEPFHAAYFSLVDDSRGNFVKGELLIPPDGGVKTLTLISNRPWSIDCQQTPWISITPTSGSGPATIKMVVTPNETLDEDFALLSVTNNTLLVVKDLKIVRQNFLGAYRGGATITSPIPGISTPVVDGKAVTITATTMLTSVLGQTSMNFTASLSIGSVPYPLDLTFEGAMQLVTEGGKSKFVFLSTGTFDMTNLGIALGDASITGQKPVTAGATLANGQLDLQLVIEPGAEGVADPAKSTVIVFRGAK